MSHAKRSPSSAEQWAVCTASVAEQEGKPDNAQDATRWGTAAHLVSSTCLLNGLSADAAKKITQPAGFLGQEVAFWVHSESDSQGEMIVDPLLEGTDFPAEVDVMHVVAIDQAMVDACTSYVTFVRELHATLGGQMLIEQRLPIDHITGEEGAGGTGDCVLLAGSRLLLIDAKFGRNKVAARRADGRMNLQLAMYASGALQQFGLMADFDSVTGIIVQPLISHTDEHTLDIATLEAEIEQLRQAARAEPVYAPGESACKYCRAFPCAAAQQKALDTVYEEFGDLDAPRDVNTLPSLGKVYWALPFVESFVDAVKEKVRRELNAGNPVEDCKLVEGKKGARRFINAQAAEELLANQFRLGEKAYDRSLISPTTAEELHKAGEIGPRQWKKLQALIEQPRCQPSIAHASDKRPAFVMSTEGITDLDNSDLL